MKQIFRRFFVLPQPVTALHFAAVLLLLLVAQLSGHIVVDHYAPNLLAISFPTQSQQGMLYQVVSSGIVAPITEELIFRCIALYALIKVLTAFAPTKDSQSLLNGLYKGISKHAVLLAMLLSSAVFALSHIMGRFSLPFQGSFAMLLAFAFLATESFPLIVSLHALWNLSLIGFIYVAGSDADFSPYYQTATVIFIFSLGLAILLFVPLFRKFSKTVTGRTFA